MSGDQVDQPQDFVTRLQNCDRRMRGVAYSMLGSADLMDDALQDAYLKAFRGYDGFREQSSFATWLASIVYRTCIDHQRRTIRRRRHFARQIDIDELDEHGGRSGPSEDRLGAMVGARVDVAVALQQLSPDHRAVLALIDLEGVPVSEAADVLHVPIGTVASRLSRARSALKRAVGHSDEHRAPSGPMDETRRRSP